MTRDFKHLGRAGRPIVTLSAPPVRGGIPGGAAGLGFGFGAGQSDVAQKVVVKEPKPTARPGDRRERGKRRSNAEKPERGKGAG